MNTRFAIATTVTFVALWGIPASSNADEPSKNLKIEQSLGRTPDPVGLEQGNDRAALGVPAEQGVSQADNDLAAAVRRDILQIEELSPQARAVQITANAGVITLKGAVPSDEEKELIADTAARYVGGIAKVTNEIEVAR